MRLFKNLKVRILKSIITWSEMGKQTAQARSITQLSKHSNKKQKNNFEVDDAYNMFAKFQICSSNMEAKKNYLSNHRTCTLCNGNAITDNAWVCSHNCKFLSFK